jgi:hypothetical protein
MLAAMTAIDLFILRFKWKFTPRNNSRAGMALASRADSARAMACRFACRIFCEPQRSSGIMPAPPRQTGFMQAMPAQA